MLYHNMADAVLQHAGPLNIMTYKCPIKAISGTALYTGLGSSNEPDWPYRQLASTSLR